MKLKNLTIECDCGNVVSTDTKIIECDRCGLIYLAGFQRESFTAKCKAIICLTHDNWVTVDFSGDSPRMEFETAIYMVAGHAKEVSKHSGVDISEIIGFLRLFDYKQFRS